MSKFLDWFTKKKLLFLSLFSSVVVFFIFQKSFVFILCQTKNYLCFSLVNYFLFFLLIWVSFLIPAIFSFFIKDKLFALWKKSAFIYLFIYIFIIVITPWSTGDVYFRIEKDLFALFSAILFNLFSLFFIIYHSIKSKKDLR